MRTELAIRSIRFLARNHLAAYRNEKSAFLKTGTEFLIAGDLQTALRAG
jgi:hypothetical protein